MHKFPGRSWGPTWAVWRSFLYTTAPALGVQDAFLRNYLDLIAFLLQGLPSNQTLTAVMAYMVEDFYRDGAIMDFPKGGSGARAARIGRLPELTESASPNRPESNSSFHYKGFHRETPGGGEPGCAAWIVGPWGLGKEPLNHLSMVTSFSGVRLAPT